MGFRDYLIHFDFRATAPNCEDIAEGMEITLKHIAKSRQKIAEARELIARVDLLLENDTCMRCSSAPMQ